jgi:hypothetical protein
VNAANICAVIEAEDGTGLIQRDMFGQSHDIPVKCTSNIVELVSSV